LIHVRGLEGHGNFKGIRRMRKRVIEEGINASQSIYSESIFDHLHVVLSKKERKMMAV